MPYNIGNILALVFIKAITVNKQHLKAKLSFLSPYKLTKPFLF